MQRELHGELGWYSSLYAEKTGPPLKNTTVWSLIRELRQAFLDLLYL